MSENERKFATTTISTIAIQSGNTKIVIALLQNADSLELKILELVPDLTLLGESFEEASELEIAHNHVLQQLQNKQSPVEELLKKADQVIADQKPQTEVYAAMADSLGQAWKDVNAHLMLRKHILHLNVTYHSKAEACVERMRVLELLCLSPIPSSEEMLKESLECMQDVKKSMLECLMGALKAGQSLLSALRELAAAESIDSRTKITKRAAEGAIARVEKWMEDLHNRRHLLDITWQRRKLNLEKYRTLSILKCDLELLEALLKDRCKILARSHNKLGDSAANAEYLLEQHLQLVPEAKNLQEEALRMLKASEQLPSSSHKFSEESNKMSYSVLNFANEYVQALNDREDLLKRSIKFFSSAKGVMLKLSEMDYQSKNVNSISERLIIMNMTEEITKDIINDGRLILEKSPEAEGIERTLAEIENSKLNLMSYCIKENEENFELSQVVNNFYEKHNEIFSWLITAIETVIQKHQDIGEGLITSQNFLHLHQKLLEELKSRNSDLLEISKAASPNVLERLRGNTRDDVNNKLKMITSHFQYLKKTLEERIRISSKYVEFHSLAVLLENELDSFARSLTAIDSVEVLKFVEPASLKIKQLHSKLIYKADNFLQDLAQTPDSYLDAKRAQLCVETVLEHFANRKSDIEEKWNIWERSALDKETSQAFWIKTMVDSENTIDWVVKLESQLYPVLNSETTDTDAQMQQVDTKLNNIIPEIKRAQKEIQLRIKTAKELIVGGTLENNEEVPPKLQELHDNVCSIILEYTVFLDIFVSFLKNVKRLEKKIVDLKTIRDSLMNPTGQQVNDVRLKHIAASKEFHDLWDISYSESLCVIERIKQQEPKKYADKDIKAVKGLIESKKLEWNSLSTNLENSLKRWQMLTQFDQDLESIHTSIKELSDELTSLQHQRSLSLSAAKSSSVAFQYFEKTIEILENKIESFVNTAEDVLEVSESKSKEIEEQLNQLKDRWNEFCAQVAETRRFIDLSIKYFTLIEETEECFREGTKLLVCVARNSSTVRSPEEAEELLKDTKAFLSSIESKQEERIKSISELVTQLFNDDEHLRQVSQIVAENNDMLDSFNTVSKELTVLQMKLKPSSVTVETSEEVSKSSEIISVEKLPSALGVEKVEVIQLSEDKSPVPEQDNVLFSKTPGSPSSPPFKKTKFFEESTVSPKQPVFVLPLSDARVPESSKFVFECKLEGYPSPDVTWMKDGLPIENNPDYQTLFDNGICKLRIEEVLAEDSARFVCRATNKFGTAETSAVLSVVETDKIDELLPPKFLVPLSDLSVIEEESCELHCKVSGNPLPVAQWFKNDVCIDSVPTYEITYNNGDAKVFIRNTSLGDSATYICIATNPLGTISTSAKLKVRGKLDSTELPAFSEYLSNVMVRAGQKLKLECTVLGKPFPTLSWFHNEKPLKELPNIIISVDDNGHVVLIILEAFPKNAGTYTLVASNAAGEASCSCHVSVKGLLPCETSDSEVPSDAEPVRPSISCPLTDQTVKEGEEASLECVIVGQPEPEVIWYHNDIPVKESDHIQLLFKGDKCSLHIKEARIDDEGVYKVIAINSAGDISSTCRLGVRNSKRFEDSPCTLNETQLCPPKFTKLLTDILIREGDTAVLACSVVGVPLPDVKWFLNNTEIKLSDRVKHKRTEEGNITLVVENITPEDRGLYTVRASNRIGEAKCFSHVIVKSLSSLDAKSSDVHLDDKYEYPTFTEWFSDQVVAEGESAKFECIVKGRPAPKVRWLFNDKPVSGKSFLVSVSGSRQVLCIPEMNSETAGVIACVAENEVGKATCRASLRLADKMTEDKLLPTLDATMNVFESAKSYELKKSVYSKSLTINDEAPDLKTDSYFTMSEQASQRINNSEPVKIESHHVEEKHELDGKLSDFSSQSFSSGNYDAQKYLNLSKQNNITSLKPARKQTAPRFLSTLNGAIVDPGKNVKFEAVIESYPPAKIKWYKNNTELSDEPNRRKITWELNRATLEIFSVESDDAGRYTCSASNDVGNASTSADLFVKNYFPPVMGKRLHPQSVAVGKRVTFEVEVTGTPTPSITWFKDDVQLAKTSPFYRLREQGNSHALIIEKARLEDGGQYKVRAHNEAGEAVSLASLHVFEPPTSITESCEISQNITDSKLTDSFTVPTTNVSTITNFSKMSSNPKPEFSKTVEVIKTGKHISFVDGEKVQDESNISKEKYKIHNAEELKELKTHAPVNEHEIKTFETSKSYSNNYETKFDSCNSSNKYFETSSEEIEVLQKPLVYSNLDSFQAYASYNNSSTVRTDNDIYLEPGPPPEIGYIPKEAVPKVREAMADRVKKLESSQRQLSPVEIPPGAVKIFPTIVPKKKEPESIAQKKYSSCIKEYKNTIQKSTKCDKDSQLQSDDYSFSVNQEAPNIKVSNVEKSKTGSEKSGPIYRPQADVDVRPLSPRPSAEGVSMEKLWSQKKTIDEQSYLRPVTPFSSSTVEESSVLKQTDLKRCSSPLPSADGLAMDKLWSHPIHTNKSSRPHSIIGISDGVTNKTAESFTSEKYGSTTWESTNGSAKTETKLSYQDICKINDDVVSENKFSESTSSCNNKGFNRSVSEEKSKNVNKKFKWPPQEVSFEDSLVRKMGSQKSEVNICSDVISKQGSPSQTAYAATTYPNFEKSFIQSTEHILEQNIEQVPQKYVPPVKKFQETYLSNQTLPRSFKFASSSNSKFKPVKPFVPDTSADKLPRKDSDYESDFEVKNISKEASSWKPNSKVSQYTQSSIGTIGSQFPNETSTSYTKETFCTSNSGTKFIPSSNSVFAKPEMKSGRESGYSADTDEPYKRSTFLQKSNNDRTTKPVEFTSSSFQKYSQENKMLTFPRVSENKAPSMFIDDTKTTMTNIKKMYPSSVTPTSNLSRSTRSDVRESDYECDYDGRIPPIWRPSDSEPEEPCYRPVRLNLTPVQRPFYNRSSSAEVASVSKFTETSKSNFKPVSPVTQYSSAAKVKPSPSFSDCQQNMNIVHDNQFNRNNFSSGDISREKSKFSQTQVWKKPGNYEQNYEEFLSTAEQSSQSMFIESNKIQKVEEIKKRFESRSNTLNEEAPLGYRNNTEIYCSGQRIPDCSVSSKQITESVQSYKSKSQQFIDNIVHNVSSKQNELKQGALKSPSLYSPSIMCEPQIFKEHYRNAEHASQNNLGDKSDLSHSVEAEYIIVNDDSSEKKDEPQTIPVFITPLHDIAAVTGSSARFECIIQSDSPYDVEWRKDGELLQNTELCRISHRNGVCKLELLKTYMYDAGTYQCIATNKAGSVSTSGTLTVSGERRSYIKK